MNAHLLNTLICLTLLFLTSCISLTDDDSIDTISREDISINIAVPAESEFHTKADSAVVKIYEGDNVLYEQILKITDSSVTGTVKDMRPSEDLLFILSVYNGSGDICYEGEATASIAGNTITEVSIDLYPVTGSAVINGTIIESTSVKRIIGSAESVKETFIAGGIKGHPSSFYTDYNYGLVEWMILGEHDSQTKARILIQFDSEYLPNEPVSSAKLALTVSYWVDHSHENENPMTIAVHKMLRPWGEGDVETEVSFIPNTHKVFYAGVTNSSGNNGATAAEASYGNPWNERMVGLDGIDASVHYGDSATHSMSEGTNIEYELDITEYLNSWIENPKSNYGVLIKPLVEDYDGPEISYPLFYTWDNTTHTNHGPQIIIE